jgi:triacylglycerol lipase
VRLFRQAFRSELVGGQSGHPDWP